MLHICFSLIPIFFMLIFCTCSTKNFYVLHNQLCCVKKKNSQRNYVGHQNYVSHTKNMLWQQKKPKERLTLTKYVSVAQKRNTCRQKTVAVTYKYMSYWLKSFVTQKILWCRAKIKVGVHECYVFVPERRVIGFHWNK